MCELTCLDMKISQSDSLKMLIFKFNKNEKEKKRGELGYGGAFDYVHRNRDDELSDTNLNHLKYVSIDTPDYSLDVN